MTVGKNKEIAKEAIWAVSNACASVSYDQMAKLVDIGVIQCFCQII